MGTNNSQLLYVTMLGIVCAEAVDTDAPVQERTHICVQLNKRHFLTSSCAGRGVLSYYAERRSSNIRFRRQEPQPQEPSNQGLKFSIMLSCLDSRIRSSGPIENLAQANRAISRHMECNEYSSNNHLTLYIARLLSNWGLF
jgi:hypothetical protein